MSLGPFAKRLEEFHNQDAIVWQDNVTSFAALKEAIADWKPLLQMQGIESGSVVIVDADFSPRSISLLLALLDLAAIVVPMSNLTDGKRVERAEIAQADFVFRFAGDEWDFEVCPPRDETDEGSDDGDEEAEEGTESDSADAADDEHELYQQLRTNRHPGIVLFSSGSTGTSKGTVHDAVPLLKKQSAEKRGFRTISFLLFDHIGGINTMLYTLANGGCLITVADRNPDTVLEAVQNHRAELLSTSPTFLNLMMLSGAAERFDISSLKLVMYGTEPMPESTLQRFHVQFPDKHLKQTYGMSEFGILRSRGKAQDSTWVRLTDDSAETRVVDGQLQIKAETAMLGYLNAPNPFTSDGWLMTGDRVEVDGEFVRFLGRQSDMINVGGRKVFPAEVEDAISQLDNVAEVTVYGESHPLMGEIVCANVTLFEYQDGMATLIKRHCREVLGTYKTPVKVHLENEIAHTDRFKKVRRASA